MGEREAGRWTGSLVPIAMYSRRMVYSRENHEQGWESWEGRVKEMG